MALCVLVNTIMPLGLNQPTFYFDLKLRLITLVELTIHPPIVPWTAVFFSSLLWDMTYSVTTRPRL